MALPDMDYLGIIVTVGVIAGGIGYVSSSFLKERRARSKEDIETENSLTTYLKNQIDGFKDIVDAQNLKITDLGKEIAAMRAVIEEKDKTIEKYLAILQNRNPELDTFIRAAMVDIGEAKTFRSTMAKDSETVTKAWREIQTTLVKLDEHMVGLDKDIKIEATVSKQ